MEAKTLEIRDKMTFIPALAIRLNPSCEADRYLLARAGYGTKPWVQAEYVLLLNLNSGSGRFSCDPHDWGPPRTMREVHKYLIEVENWDNIISGQVVDVEYLLDETIKPKRSESQEFVA